MFCHLGVKIPDAFGGDGEVEREVRAAREVQDDMSQRLVQWCREFAKSVNALESQQQQHGEVSVGWKSFGSLLIDFEFLLV